MCRGRGRAFGGRCCTLAGAVVVAGPAPLRCKPLISPLYKERGSSFIVRGLRPTRSLAQTRLPGLVF